MTLIATGKIADYIYTHPETRVTLLTWLKESDYWMHCMFTDRDGLTPTGFVSGSMQPETGEIVVRYNVNYSAKAICITDIKNHDEVMQEMDEYRKRNPGSTSHVKVVEVALTSPPLLEATILPDEQETTGEALIVSSSLFAYDYQQDIQREQDTNTAFTFTTEAEYRTALTRAEDIFNSQPENDTYQELLSLLPSIECYEQEQLHIPAISLQEIVIHRSVMFNLPQDYLCSLVGSKDNLDDLLNGSELPEDTMKKLFQTLMLRFPMKDKRFFE